MTILTKDRLDEVVAAVKETLSDPKIRAVNQRAVQAKVWHHQPAVAACLTDLRKEEEEIRTRILKLVSHLVYHFHDRTVDATLARAGILQDDRVNAGSSLDKKDAIDLFCLDAKERLYLVMNHYGWLQEFFRAFPMHFYENSFQFVHNIPKKKLKVKVKVVGLGIGGSMAISGLAKAGIECAVGYEKRVESGVSSVGSRYQNASWRAYDVARDLLDEAAYDHLIEYRQRFTVTFDDGTTKMVTSDRVQIILGDAIEVAQASAKRYGAKLVFGANADQFFDSDSVEEPVDIVALFAGAHTSQMFPGLAEEMSIHSWPDISSVCDMWLRIKPSEKKDFYCIRSGEVGAEHWHYTIESARNTVEDVVRVQNSLVSQYQWSCKKMVDASEEEKEILKRKFEGQMAQLDAVKKFMNETDGGRFDYIFTNAPSNEHNARKREEASADGTVVLEGGYVVDVKFASNAMVNKSGDLLSKFATDLIVMGGDACVPPNPQAAYGATLACESAQMVVQLATSYGHLNSIIQDLDDFDQMSELKEQVQELKDLFAAYYAAKSRSENYFQWVQTLICNIYSLPKQ